MFLEISYPSDIEPSFAALVRAWVDIELGFGRSYFRRVSIWYRTHDFTKGCEKIFSSSLKEELAPRDGYLRTALDYLAE